jgi:Diacylglycerol acyltransferase
VPCCARLIASYAPGRDREQVYWSPRLGVCRIALQTGTAVVPTYDLGQSQVRLCTSAVALQHELSHKLPGASQVPILTR